MLDVMFIVVFLDVGYAIPARNIAEGGFRIEDGGSIKILHCFSGSL
jgi:hypothetical protein